LKTYNSLFPLSCRKLDISQNYYYQGGDNIDYYYSQRGDNPHWPQRGNIQYKGGRGQIHFNSRDNRDIDGHFQPNREDQESNFQDNKETNFQKADSKENIEESTRNRHDRNLSLLSRRSYCLP
jgi:hypothetical protein